MQVKDLKKNDLPDTPGVYIFRGTKKEILYIGKATSLRDRVRSYFASDIATVRSPLIARMVDEAKDITWEETDSVLDALILEANLIKKHQPIYNSREKDDKSFNYVVITNEMFPRVLSVRGKDLPTFKVGQVGVKAIYGPYPKGGQFKEAIKIIRKIFPFFDTKFPITDTLTRAQEKSVRFNQSIGVYPGRAGEKLDKKGYARTVRHLKLFFEGKKKQLIKQLEREMKQFAKEERFEEATEVRRQLFALTHIQDVSLVKEEYQPVRAEAFRIEAYDVAHTSGKQVTGVMTVIVDGEAQKGEFRKFKVSRDANNDVAALREVLSRRLGHSEWRYPKLIVVDGGAAQVNIAKKVLAEYGYAIPVVGVVKDEHHRPKGFVGDKDYMKEYERDIVLANAEAHRFSVLYHRKLRSGL
ncbi:MAG: GIY-YIG nuclease family protein [Candidatus Pacebacteria bacterium]|nr:GIY-YIG nuclease family protein [Candidatus Paceibacterota bacterium]